MEELLEAASTDNQYDQYCDDLQFAMQPVIDSLGISQCATNSTNLVTQYIDKVRKIASAMTNNFRRLQRLAVMKQINAHSTQGVKSLYRYLRRDLSAPSSVVVPPNWELHFSQ